MNILSLTQFEKSFSQNSTQIHIKSWSCISPLNLSLYSLQQFKEIGLVQQLILRYEGGYPICQTDDSGTVTLNMQSVSGAFILMAIFYAAALLYLIMEILYSFYANRKKAHHVHVAADATRKLSSVVKPVLHHWENEPSYVAAIASFLRHWWLWPLSVNPFPSSINFRET